MRNTLEWVVPGFPWYGRKESVMAPHVTAPDQRPLRPDPEHGKSPTESGIFLVFVLLLGASFLLAIGIKFITDPMQPDPVGYGMLVLTAVFLFDATRRLIHIATGKVRR